MTPKLLLFDVDQTLIYTDGAGRKAFESALLKLFGISEGLKNISISGKTDTSILYDALKRHSRSDRLTPDIETEFWETYLSNLRNRVKIAEKAAVLEGAAELLSALSQRSDVYLGLLTGNIQRGAKIKLEHFDLWRYFPVGAFGGDNPDRNIVAQIALERSRRHFGRPFPIEQVYVIGDSPNDIACAGAIQAKSIIVATGSHSYEALKKEKPYSLFRTLADTRKVIETLQGKPYFEPNREHHA